MCPCDINAFNVALAGGKQDERDKRDAPKPKSPKDSSENIYNGENGPPILQKIESGKISGFQASEQDNGNRRNKDWMDGNKK